MVAGLLDLSNWIAWSNLKHCGKWSHWQHLHLNLLKDTKINNPPPLFFTLHSWSSDWSWSHVAEVAVTLLLIAALNVSKRWTHSTSVSFTQRKILHDSVQYFIFFYLPSGWCECSVWLVRSLDGVHQQMVFFRSLHQGCLFRFRSGLWLGGRRFTQLSLSYFCLLLLGRRVLFEGPVWLLWIRFLSGNRWLSFTHLYAVSLQLSSWAPVLQVSDNNITHEKGSQNIPTAVLRLWSRLFAVFRPFLVKDSD